MRKFALAGNPNSGKTTLFNSLTGATAHVGNWPGVTVDKREGSYRKFGEPIYIVDLTGIYSLSPYTPEEVISRNYILEENKLWSWLKIIRIVKKTVCSTQFFLLWYLY